MTKLTSEELAQLIRLRKRAMTTPVIKMTSSPSEKDWASKAWDDVADFMDELGKKYSLDFSERKHAIMPDTGEIVEIGKRI